MAARISELRQLFEFIYPLVAYYSILIETAREVILQVKRHLTTISGLDLPEFGLYLVCWLHFQSTSSELSENFYVLNRLSQVLRYLNFYSFRFVSFS